MNKRECAGRVGRTCEGLRVALISSSRTFHIPFRMQRGLAHHSFDSALQNTCVVQGHVCRQSLADGSCLESCRELAEHQRSGPRQSGLYKLALRATGSRRVETSWRALSSCIMLSNLIILHNSLIVRGRPAYQYHAINTFSVVPAKSWRPAKSSFCKHKQMDCSTPCEPSLIAFRATGQRAPLWLDTLWQQYRKAQVCEIATRIILDFERHCYL